MKFHDLVCGAALFLVPLAARRDCRIALMTLSTRGGRRCRCVEVASVRAFASGFGGAWLRWSGVETLLS